ncbi:MAG: TolC family protein, partial [Chloroflexia bacterium]|nr:TolC family protein [Chloroflexia bacterium]
ALNLGREYEGATDAQVSHTRQLTAYAVHSAFNQVLLTREHRLVAEQALDLSRKNLADVQSKLRQGVARNFDLLRAEAQVSQSEADRIAAENAERKSRMALFRLLEIPLDSPRDVVGALCTAPENQRLSDPFSVAMKHRPDLVAAHHMMSVQREAVRVAQSGSRPAIVAFGQGKYANPDRSHADEWEDSWMVGVRAEIPIFDGLQTRGKVQQARAQLRQAELHYEDTISQVRLEIAQAEADIETARRLVDALAQNVAEAEESLQLARRAYEEGLQEQIDVITAQLALMNSKHRHATALYQQTMAQRALELAAGILVADADASSDDTGARRAPITTGE